jgi:N-glycosylase/DNA lyase
MKFIKIRASDFDLAMTLDSGQVFHWEKAGDGFLGAIGDLAVYVEQGNDILKVRFGGPPKPARGPRALPGIVVRYFALDHALTEICDSFPKDPVMNTARDFCRGLRIIRQPKWECLATFICSSMKQVAHIRQISLALRRQFGEPRKVGKHVVYTFPSAQRIAEASESALRKCALGYRAKNLRQQYLPRRKKMTAQDLRDFSEGYFGQHGGYAQQYLFHHARVSSRNQQ